MAVFLGPAWAPDGTPFLVEPLEGRRSFHPQRHKQRTRLVVDDYGNAVAYERRCSSCPRWLPLGFTHFTAKTVNAQGMQTTCKACMRTKKWLTDRRDPERARQLARERYRRAMADPEYARFYVARQRVWTLRARERDPVRTQELDRARHKRHYDRIKADPERYARYLEKQRMSHRLRNERRTGVSVLKMRTISTVLPHDPVGNHLTLPGPLLAAAIRQYSHKTKATLTDVCAKSGFVLRAYDRWNHGDGASVPAINGFLTFSGLCWWDVWTEESGAYEQARAVFEADDLRRAA